MAPFDENFFFTALVLMTPILLVALGELIAERSGVINVGLEGMMLVGAFFSYWMATEVDSHMVGLLAGIVAGASLAALMALLSINARADQIIVGIGIWIFGLGLTGFLFREVFASRAQILVSVPQRIEIPLLHEIPGVGPVLFEQTGLVYVAILLVPLVWFVLYRTTWGLAIRAAGDLPGAAASGGLSVRQIRWFGTLCAGALSGIGGAFLSLGQVGTFLPEMSAGRGFLALAAVIFGRWSPTGVMGACFLFGGAQALQLRLQGLPDVPRSVWVVVGALFVAYALNVLRQRPSGWRQSLWVVGAVGAVLAVSVLFVVDPSISLASELWIALPYLVTIVALAGLSRRGGTPAFLGIPYSMGADDL
ncbi:MAG: ABC transporter permease [Acidimicrobiia bacterium]